MKTVINLIFVFLLSTTLFAQSDFENVESEWNDGRNFLVFEADRTSNTQIFDCYQLNRFSNQKPNKLFIKKIIEKDNHFSIEGAGFIRRNVKLDQCVHWRDRFSVYLLYQNQWLKWREYSPIEKYSPSNYSAIRRKYKRQTRFYYKLFLGHSNYGNEELQARLCFQVQEGEYMYSKPFPVKISQEQLKWVIKKNKE